MDELVGDLVRVCFTACIRTSLVDEYRARHREVWPEMLDALRVNGWRDYSLFVREDGLLVGYLECDDFEAARSGMAGLQVNARWQAEMDPFFDIAEGLRPDESFTTLAEVFHLD